MNVINRLLINAADALFWLWDLTKAVFGPVFAVLDHILDVVLSPLLGVINPICTVIGDGVYAVLAPLPVWLGLTVLSILLGVVMLIAFRYLSNQTAIGRIKDDIKANLLALKLYKDELRVTFRAQGRLLWAVLRLQRYVLTPVLILLLPMLLGLAQMGLRYQWRPLHPGETVNIEMTLETSNGAEPRASARATTELRARVPTIQLEPNPGVAEAVMVPGGGKVVWRIRAGGPGRHKLVFAVYEPGDELHANESGLSASTGGQAASGTRRIIEKELVVGSEFQRVSAKRVGSDWIDLLLHPSERLLSDENGVKSIEVLYPGVGSYIYGANWWVLYFFVISMATALILKPLFKVKF